MESIADSWVASTVAVEIEGTLTTDIGAQADIYWFLPTHQIASITTIADDTVSATGEVDTYNPVRAIGTKVTARTRHTTRAKIVRMRSSTNCVRIKVNG